MTQYLGFARSSLFKIIGFSALIIMGIEAPSLAQDGASSSLFEDAQGQLSLRQESFVSPDYNQTEVKHFQFIGGGVDTLARARNESEIANGLQTQTNGAVSPNVSVLSYLNVAQLYWKQEHFVVGRRKENWSQLDDIWTMGLYQPLFRWNPIVPESQGLSGIFLQFQKEDVKLPWGIVLFGSPLFIPHQEAGFEVENGKFVASNPYFGQRPVQAEISGQTDEIKYRIEKPPMEKVVSNQSFAGKIYLGNPHSGFLLQSGFAHKPANELSLGIDAYASANNTIEVNVLPTIAYHTLASADLQYSWKHVVIGVSGVKEDRESPEFESQWTYADYDKSTLVSPYAKFRYRGWEILTSYLDVAGGEKHPQGNLSSEGKDFLSNRYAFGNSYLLKVSMAQRLVRQQILKVAASYQQGASNEYGLVTANMAYQFDPSWSFSLSGQLIRVADNDAGEKTAYSSFVNNDSATVGVQYVF